jgi:hypothetical protein
LALIDVAQRRNKASVRAIRFGAHWAAGGKQLMMWDRKTHAQVATLDVHSLVIREIAVRLMCSTTRNLVRSALTRRAWLSIRATDRAKALSIFACTVEPTSVDGNIPSVRASPDGADKHQRNLSLWRVGNVNELKDTDHDL